MEKETERPGKTISNQGDNQNTMENLEVRGDVEQNNEIHQSYSERNSETVIPDPNAQNFWIDICETVANLPISEAKIIGTFSGLGGLGFLATLAITSPWSGFSVDSSQYDLLLGLAFISSISLGFAVGYMNTEKDSHCPECGERFAVRTKKVRKIDRTARENAPDVIHGKREVQCRNCGFEKTRPDTWTPDEFSNLQSN